MKSKGVIYVHVYKYIYIFKFRGCISLKCIVSPVSSKYKSAIFAFSWGQDCRNTNSHTSQLSSKSNALVMLIMLVIVQDVNLGVAIFLFGCLVSFL